MKLWLLERIDKSGWDITIGWVICAESELDARLVAAKEDIDGTAVWGDPVASTCREIGRATTEPGVVLKSVKHG